MSNQPPVTREQLVAAERQRDMCHGVDTVEIEADHDAYAALESRALAHKAACERALREAARKRQAAWVAWSTAHTAATFRGTDTETTLASLAAAANAAGVRMGDANKAERDAADAFCAACDVLEPLEGESNEKA